MKFIQYYSSSRGNLYEVVAENGKRLLLECGISWRKLRRSLDYDLSNIVGCLLTHEHQDHCKAIEDVMQAGIDVYASKGTFDALDIIDNRKAKIIEDRILTRCQEFDIFSFSLEHDAKEPLGFIIREKDIQEHLLFVPDTSYITPRFATAFDIIAIECSYDRDILHERVDLNSINETVAKRLLTSHMEKRTTMRYLAEFCDLDFGVIELVEQRGKNGGFWHALLEHAAD